MRGMAAPPRQRATRQRLPEPLVTDSEIAMRSEDLLELIRRQPFAPFRIVTTDGRTYEILHPDLIIVLRTRFVVGVGGDNGVPEHLEHVALVHVVRIEEMPTQAPSEKPTNGE